LILLCNDVVEAYTLFKDSFLSIIDSVAPVKQVRIKQRSEEWINVDILQCINERDRAFRQYIKTNLIKIMKTSNY